MLHWSAITLAAHVSLILSVVFLLWNAIVARTRLAPDAPLSLFSPMLEPVVFFLSAVVIERAYYVLARALSGSGIDLWSAHPTPEFLSTTIAVTCFWLAAKARFLATTDWTRSRNIVISQAIVLIIGFLGLGWFLW